MNNGGTKEIRMTEDQAWRIYRLLEEMNDFLHQRRNYPSVEQVHRWLEGGVYQELSDLYYKVAGPWFKIDEETGYIVGPGGKLYNGSVEVGVPAKDNGKGSEGNNRT
jgi:hypothetical protein